MSGGVVGAEINEGIGGVWRAIGEFESGSESIVDAEIAASVSGMTIDTAWANLGQHDRYRREKRKNEQSSSPTSIKTGASTRVSEALDLVLGGGKLE